MADSFAAEMRRYIDIARQRRADSLLALQLRNIPNAELQGKARIFAALYANVDLKNRFGPAGLRDLAEQIWLAMQSIPTLTAWQAQEARVVIGSTMFAVDNLEFYQSKVNQIDATMNSAFGSRVGGGLAKVTQGNIWDYLANVGRADLADAFAAGIRHVYLATTGPQSLATVVGIGAFVASAGYIVSSWLFGP